MINLLREEDKIFIKTENLRRLIVVAGILFFTLICISIILLLPSYLLLVFQEKNFEKQLLLVKESFKREDIDDIESSAEGLNSRLVYYEEQKKFFIQPSSLLLEIINKKPHSILLDNFFYQKSAKKEKPDKISLNGFALNRDSFISFVKALEQSGLFSKVESPLSNLLREKDINFSLNLELTK